ncbi:MAG: MmcB family DNA repair protein [Roseinatronobacter sp.]|jgi:hypothetical protein|nr:MmcB family DNA repair protein [Roseinatronobacter sp.]
MDDLTEQRLTEQGLAPGFRLARGVCRYLVTAGFAPLTEFVPQRGARVDVIALGPKGEVWIVECKSSRADFISDRKWQTYLAWCDRFFWAVPPEFSLALLPEETGVILADDFGAEMVRMAAETRLAAARRRALTQAFAHQAALRLARARDPGFGMTLDLP